jgi:hypothetical protein
MRKYHYWKAAGPSKAPSEVIVFDTETWHGPFATGENGEIQRFRLGCALAYRLEKGKRTRIKELDFERTNVFWELVTSRLDRRRPVWIVGHNIAYDIGSTGGWSVLCSDRFRADKVVVTNSIFYLKGFLDNKPITFVDTFNYYKCSLRAIGENFGLPKLEMPNQLYNNTTWFEYCRRDVQVTARAFDELLTFVKEEKLGPWQPTIAGLAFSGFRSRFMQHKVLVNAHPQALPLERSSYYGGIVDTPRVGPISQTYIHELDVCSMYPAMCLKPLPAKLRGYSRRIGPRVIAKLMSEFHVIADVEIVNSDKQYPIRLKDGTYYPTGSFRTILPHPELELAFKRKHVGYIHQAAWYETQHLFKDYMLWAADGKARMRSEGNKSWATIFKYYANSLYGKTGQLSPMWCEWNAEAMERLEETHGLYPGTLAHYADKVPVLYDFEETIELCPIQEQIEVRDYYGAVEVKVGEFESRDSCPAIAATVTSYARVLMRQFQETAGVGNWFYTDTDSIWVSDDGLFKLIDADMVAPETLGMLKYERQHENMVVYGPKDYETNLVRRLKGVKISAKRVLGGGWEQLHFPSPYVQIRDGLTDAVFVRKVVKHLKREHKRCHVNADGTTTPLTFPAEQPKWSRHQPSRRRS